MSPESAAPAAASDVRPFRRRAVAVVQAPNAEAGRRALALFIAALAVAAAAPLVGAEPPAPTLALVAFALAPLAIAASRAAVVASLDEGGITERGLVGSRRIRWDEVRRIEWHRYGGVERLTLRASRLRAIRLTSDRRGWPVAAARVESIARARAIPIVADV